MKSLVLVACLGLGLAGCAAPVPDSGAGVSDYSRYEVERARRESGAPQTAGSVVMTPNAAAALPGSGQAAPMAAPPPVSTSGIGRSDLAAAGIGGMSDPFAGNAAGSSAYGAPATAVAPGPVGQAYPAPSAAPSAVAGYDPTRSSGVQASPSNAAPALSSHPGISNSQDFAAVSETTTIEADAARRAELQANYQVVQPTQLPDRSADTGPNIVQFALSTTNRRGQEAYSRFTMFGSQGKFERNCASYRSPDEAQRDFLARGGPDRDPRGIDPDGDGFACGWDPAPFRAAVNG